MLSSFGTKLLLYTLLCIDVLVGLIDVFTAIFHTAKLIDLGRGADTCRQGRRAGVIVGVYKTSKLIAAFTLGLRGG